MCTVEPRPGALEELRADVPADGPFALVNLLRFADDVVLDGHSMSGAQAYEHYVAQIEPALVRAGGRPAFLGRARTVLIGPPDERWDHVAVVCYPSREAFERVVSSDEYRAAARYRAAALADARLIALTSPRRIGRVVAWLWALAVRIRRR
jgi:uncharacterized protein (DUF1330 family)